MNCCRWALLFGLLVRQSQAQSGCAVDLKDFFVAPADLMNTLEAEPRFFDEPNFTIAGVTDNTYRGGHGSDTVLRSAETLANAAASLGAVNESQRDPLTAVQEFQRAAELNPSESNLFDWGTELLIHRATEPAAQVFTKGVRLFPQSVRMLLGLATAWYVAGSYQYAAECFFKATDINPSDPKPYVFLSKVQAKEITQSAGYAERLARFVQMQPDSALANYFYAVTLWNQRNEPRAARALLGKAIAIDPHLGPAYLELGVIDAAERKYPEAIREYQKAIEVSPELEEAHYRLSEAYRIMDDRVNAARELELYKQMSKESAERVERERREMRQFVVTLRSP